MSVEKFEEMTITTTEQPTHELEKKFHLTGDVCLTIHTKSAYSLFDGTWKYQEMGLLQFAELMRNLCFAARKDDPYAESYLLKTYDAILAMHKDIQKIESYCAQQLTQVRGFEVPVFSNTQFHKKALRFYTPFSYMGARLIADLDYTLRQAYSLKQMGILLDRDKLPARLMPKIRMLFGLARRWHYHGITRKDVLENNQIAQRAKTDMGDISAAVLQKKIRFVFLPRPLWQSYLEK
ncbi:MAG TPA: AcaB family transcriptional regulator [Gammaproteobacteria bacterium]|nr:AcaB family transcriptional regulator [Gammaproteobacteria bacterium]HVY53030.1 AcaB family transcriptional regulator [Gammaproteobacteria bacterium]